MRHRHAGDPAVSYRGEITARRLTNPSIPTRQGPVEVASQVPIRNLISRAEKTLLFNCVPIARVNEGLDEAMQRFFGSPVIPH